MKTNNAYKVVINILSDIIYNQMINESQEAYQTNEKMREEGMITNAANRDKAGGDLCKGEHC